MTGVNPAHCSQPGHLTQVQWGYGANWAWSVPLTPGVDVVSKQISSKFRSCFFTMLHAMLEAICDRVSCILSGLIWNKYDTKELSVAGKNS
jgi:hypothetical protein